MSSQIAWHSLRWLLLTLAGGLLYDGFKSSVVASGFELLLPDLVFLIKPVMVAVGITLGGTFLSISAVDLWRAWRKRTNEKNEAICKAEALELKHKKESQLAAEQKKKDERNRRRKYILTRLDFLVNWHELAKHSVTLTSAQKAGDQVTASDYVNDLVGCKLIRPGLYDPVKSWGSSEAINYLASVRSKFTHRGLEAAQEFVEQWRRYDAQRSKIDTSDD